MIILTGTYPPERCGVGDYVRHLLSTPTGKDWTLLYLKGWRLRDLKENIARLRDIEDKTLNLQYPTMGYGTSLVPHLMAMYAVMFLHKSLYITVHEYSQLGWKGKAALQFLFLFATNVIFTTSLELSLARKQGLSAKKGVVIKINSNIPASQCIKSMADRKWDVGYFGYIRPLKGIEDFIPVAEALSRAGKRVYIMGQTQPEYAAFHEPLLRDLGKKGIEYIADKSQEGVADILADTKIMYLPYPDGLSERRGSFLAAIVNGAAVVTMHGAFTSPEQLNKFTMVTPFDALESIRGWLENREWLEASQRNSLTYVQESVPASWEQVAQMYSRIIQ